MIRKKSYHISIQYEQNVPPILNQNGLKSSRSPWRGTTMYSPLGKVTPMVIEIPHGIYTLTHNDYLGFGTR